jgi:tripartite-type tricarboxylate transporter receptor subunit TctC
VAGAIGRVPFGPEAFDAFAQTGSVKLVFVVKEGGKYSSFDDVKAAATDKPGEIPTASSIGGSVHLAGLLLSQSAGVKFRIVHVGGGSNRIKSVLGDHTDHTFFSTAEYNSYKDSGVKALMMIGPDRHPNFPDIPSSKELGYDVDFGIDYWWFAPKGTPKDRLAKLTEVWEAAMKDEELQSALKEKGISPNFLDAQAAEKRIMATYSNVKQFSEDLKKK